PAPGRHGRRVPAAPRARTAQPLPAPDTRIWHNWAAGQAPPDRLRPRATSPHTPVNDLGPVAHGRPVARRQAVGLSDHAGLLISLDGVEVISSTGLATQLENPLGRRTVRAGLLRGNEAVTIRLTLPATTSAT
ncbi:MAG: hypothetical protein ACRDOE_18690, partial [Streptosporangiaceae bacterium]